MTFAEALDKTVTELDTLEITGYRNMALLVRCIERLCGMRDAIRDKQAEEEEQAKQDEQREGTENDQGNSAEEG